VADDSMRVKDLFLAEDLEALGCGAIAEAIRSAGSHEGVDWITLQCLELLTATAQGKEVLNELLWLLEAHRDAANREEEVRREAAKQAGARARAAGLIAADDVALLNALRDLESPYAESLEMCTNQADVDKAKDLIRWVAARSFGGEA